MTLIKLNTAAALLGALSLTACGGGSGGDKCPTFVMDFSDGPSTAYFRQVRPDVIKGLETCPHVVIKSYVADGDTDKAKVSQNIASNFFSTLADDVESKTKSIEDAGPADLAGKVEVILLSEAPE